MSRCNYPINTANMSAEEKSNYLDRMAYRRAKMKLFFFLHLAIYIGVNLSRYIAINYLGYTPRYGGVWHPLWFWGLAVLIHGLLTYTLLPGSGFRERLIARERKTLEANVTA